MWLTTGMTTESTRTAAERGRRYLQGPHDLEDAAGPSTGASVSVRGFSAGISVDDEADGACVVEAVVVASLEMGLDPFGSFPIMVQDEDREGKEGVIV